MALATPLDITTPSLWLDLSDESTLYDAASGGSLVAADGLVARIEDKSGNGNHCTATSGARPTLKTNIQNGRSILRFDGTNYLTGATNATTGNAKTVVGICRSTNAAGGVLWSSRTSGRAFIARPFRSGGITYISGDVTTTNVTTPLDITTPMQSFFLQAWRSPANLAIEYRANGAAQSTSGTILSDTGATGYRLGTASALIQMWPGDIGGITVIDGYATTAVVEALEGYYAHWWGVASLLPSDHPYKAAAPTVGSPSRRRRSAQASIRSTF